MDVTVSLEAAHFWLQQLGLEGSLWKRVNLCSFIILHNGSVVYLHFDALVHFRIRSNAERHPPDRALSDGKDRVQSTFTQVARISLFILVD